MSKGRDNRRDLHLKSLHTEKKTKKDLMGKGTMKRSNPDMIMHPRGTHKVIMLHKGMVIHHKGTKDNNTIL